MGTQKDSSVLLGPLGSSWLPHGPRENQGKPAGAGRMAMGPSMDGGPGPASYLHVASGRVQTERPQTLDGWMPEVTLSANIYITLEEALAG